MTAHAGGDAVSEGLKSALSFDGSIFSQITKAWSSGDTGAAANSAVSAMTNPAAAAASLAIQDNGNPPVIVNPPIVSA